MSFESVSSLPEVSSQQVRGELVHGSWSPDHRQVFGAQSISLGIWNRDSHLLALAPPWTA